jgi:hypothetical protein
MHSSLFIVAALTLAGFGAENINYDAARQGQLPPGWSAPASHKWEVRSDKTAPSHPNVLRGAPGDATESDPPLALFDKIVCRDGDLSVKFRIEGSRGNAAGVIWRYQDPRNYYLLSLSADEKNIVLQRIRNGVAELIATSGGKPAAVGVSEDIRPGQWHVIKVSFRGPRVQVFFGNRSVFTAQDAGISGPGKTGLWAKGPNGAAFDDFRIDKKA